MGKGIALSRLNRIAEAKAAFDSALAQSKNNSLIIREAGRFHYTKGGDPKKAASLLQKAVLLNPRDLMGLFFYARMLDEQGKTQAAFDTFSRLVKQLPEDPEVREFFGRSLGRNGYLFDGHLQLAYAALFRNDAKKTAYFSKRAKGLAKTDAENERLATFEKAYEERKEFWEL